MVALGYPLECALKMCEAWQALGPSFVDMSIFLAHNWRHDWAWTTDLGPWGLWKPKDHNSQMGLHSDNIGRGHNIRLNIACRTIYPRVVLHLKQVINKNFKGRE